NVRVVGNTVTPVYVQITNPVTLTCPADDQATNLTWTGPGGHLWVTGTTVEDGVDGGSIPRISANHSGGSYTLTLTQVWAKDTGVYTCTVDGTVGLQMVIVQGGMLVNVGYTGRGLTATLPCSYNGGPAEWSVTSPTVFLYTSGSDINPSLPESTRTRINVVWGDSDYALQITDVQLSDIREYRCVFGYRSIFYYLLLYITPRFPEVENTVMLDGQNITRGVEDANLTLTCNAHGGTPPSTVSWIRDNTTLVTWGTKAQYTKMFTRNDDKSLYICQSSSPALSSPQTTSVLVYLDLKPYIPHLSPYSSPVENTDIQIVCESVGSRPAADIEWNVGGTWLSINPGEVKVLDTSTDTYTVTSSLSRRVTRQDNGKSVYCRVSNRALSGGIESVRQTITVLCKYL
ncbi:hemicentin-2-like, partial [Argopecten irradians]|uniref:hemicentin-2-like n=1 Tax=Argopecten irradians TaxID=31199 RepID=UPI003718008A